MTINHNGHTVTFFASGRIAVDGKMISQMNIKNQIDRVVSAQGLSRADAADQVRGRVYDARQYLTGRAVR